MTDMDKAVIGVLLKSLLEKGLISEAACRGALDRLNTLPRPAAKEVTGNGHPQGQG